MLKWISNNSLGTRDCITTVREIVIPGLYEGEDLIHIQEKVALATKYTTMTEAMSGMQRAGFASELYSIEFKKTPKTFEKGTPFEHRLNVPVEAEKKLSDHLLSEVSNIYGWHVFGLSLVDGFHSVTLFAKHDAERTQFFWADQLRRLESTIHEQNSKMGFREYSKDSLDKYVEHYTDCAWNKYRVDHFEAIRRIGLRTCLQIV